MVLSQLASLESLPDSGAGRDIAIKLPSFVQKLSKYLPDLEELKTMKKHGKMQTEKQLKVFLGELANNLNEAMDFIKMGKALMK